MNAAVPLDSRRGAACTERSTSYAALKLMEAQEQRDDAAVRYWTRVRDLVDISAPLDEEQKAALRSALMPTQGSRARPPCAALAQAA